MRFRVRVKLSRASALAHVKPTLNRSLTLTLTLIRPARGHACSLTWTGAQVRSLHGLTLTLTLTLTLDRSAGEMSSWFEGDELRS